VKERRSGRREDGHPHYLYVAAPLQEESGGRLSNSRWRGSGHSRLVGRLVRRDAASNAHE